MQRRSIGPLLRVHDNLENSHVVSCWVPNVLSYRVRSELLLLQPSDEFARLLGASGNVCDSSHHWCKAIHMDLVFWREVME